ncbi:hypothetical protein A0O34_21910 (plasmid) [Chryseobacterium glaciei]|uniref:Uncharacterized protein n=1 Tax=Chryseobacterium glaciei TaxID=1685010 RepID=A0A172Y227_9FLAO|nr:hypothetical protein A0O34_21910 [Chryseobacterium glaciei]
MEPSAGIGAFLNSFSRQNIGSVTAYEKDLLTGKVLTQLYPDCNIHTSGFEEIPDSEKKSTMLLPAIYLLAILLFLTCLFQEGDEAKKQATRSS